MSISHSLSNALSGLNAASRMAEVVSSNLANALTDGYGRRRVDLAAMSVGGRGAGVRIDGISRLVDRGILSDRRLAEAGLSGQSTISAALSRLEQVIGAAGDDTALPARLAALESSLVAAAADPGSDIRLGEVVHRFNGVVGALNDSSAGLAKMRQDADADIAGQVDTLNRSLKQIEVLNADITRTNATGGDPSALLDQRQAVVDRISGIVPVREMDRGNGQIALITTGGATLIDGKAAEYGFAATPVITADMTLQSGALSGLTRKGTPIDPAKGIGNLAGGSLGAAFTLRDETLVAAQDGLDAVARDLIERFQDPTTDPTRLAGTPGLLTDGGGVLDPLDTVGLAGRIRVNGLIDPSKGGALYRLRDGIGAAGPGPIGESAQISAWSNALAQLRPLAGGGTATGASGHASRLVSEIGSQRLNAEERQSFANARWGALREAELAGGVDSDHEMQMLLRIEQAYAANARVVETIQSMMQTLMEL